MISQNLLFSWKFLNIHIFSKTLKNSFLLFVLDHQWGNYK